jgi:hypothetical protein
MVGTASTAYILLVDDVNAFRGPFHRPALRDAPSIPVTTLHVGEFPIVLRLSIRKKHLVNNSSRRRGIVEKEQQVLIDVESKWMMGV